MKFNVCSSGRTGGKHVKTAAAAVVSVDPIRSIHPTIDRCALFHISDETRGAKQREEEGIFRLHFYDCMTQQQFNSDMNRFNDLYPAAMPKNLSKGFKTTEKITLTLN